MMQIRHEGLTFVHTSNGQVQVWEGEIAESRLVGTGVVDGMVMGIGGPVPLLDVLNEELLRSWADEWLMANPEARPLTPEQILAREALSEVLVDILTDPEIRRPREEVLSQSKDVQQFVVACAQQITRTTQAKVIGGKHPAHATQEALLEALTGALAAGFIAGQTFQQRGYSL